MTRTIYAILARRRSAVSSDVQSYRARMLACDCVRRAKLSITGEPQARTRRYIMKS